MIESNTKYHIEEQIEKYLNGELSEQEVDELWAELLTDDYYYDYMKSMAALKRVVEKQEEKNKISTLNISKQWAYAAVAAVLLFSASLFLFDFGGQSETIQPIATIELDYYRSAEGTVGDDNPEVLNEAIQMANRGEINDAIEYIDDRLAENPDKILKANLLVTAGSILYNEGRYEGAISRFQTALELNPDDVLVIEQSYWYLANAYFQLNRIAEAREALQSTYELDGAYNRVAQSYLRALSVNSK